jgi:predicted dehydrogenase
MDHITGTTDHTELFKNPDIDVIDICTPTPLHAEMVVPALAAGKHVISEKPLARTLEDGKKIADAARSAQTFHMPAMCMRFWPQWAWLKQAVAEKRYGRVLGATFRRVTSPLTGWFNDGKISGGALLDLHVHDTDFIHYLFGKPQAVFSRGYAKVSGEIDHLVTNYLYKDIPLVVAEGSWSLQPGVGFRMQYTVNFENATADFDLGRADQLLVTQDGKQAAVECAKEMGYDAELRYFVDCVEKGERPTVVTADDALIALKTVHAESESIVKGTVVQVSV